MKRMSKLFFSVILLGGLLFSSCKEKSGTISPESSEHERTPTWGEPVYDWTTDYSKCHALRVCNEDQSLIEEETSTSSYTVTKEAECEVPGVGVFTAEFTNPAFETQTVEVAIEALVHVYGEPIYEWSDDYRTCTAKRICVFSPNHVDSETVNSVEEVFTPATYESEGESRFTATFENPAFETQSLTTNTQILDDLVFTLNGAGDAYSVKMNEGSVVDVIYIPSTYNSLPVTSIENGAFSANDHNVKKIVIPPTVTSIDSHAFEYNPYLVEVEGLIVMYQNMFINCISLRRLVFAESYTIVRQHCFQGCHAEEYAFPGAVEIEHYAFQDCDFVTNLTFGKNLATIGSYPFLRTPSLKRIDVDPECTKFYSDDGILYSVNGSEKTLLLFPANNPTQNYTLLEGTTKIQGTAFSGTRHLHQVTLNSDFAKFNGEDFLESGSIRKVVITNSNIVMQSERVFTDCPNLEEVVFPAGANYVCQNGLIMNKNKTTIYYVLGGYTGVVYVPSTVSEIKYSMAYRCVRTPAFVVESQNDYFCAEDGILLSKDKTKIMRYPYRADETVITKDSIPNTVTTLNNYSFSGFPHITSMDFSGSSVSKYLFGSLSNNAPMTRVKFSASLNELGPYLLSDNNNLSELVFPMNKDEFVSGVTRNIMWLVDTPESINAIFNDVTVEAHTI